MLYNESLVTKQDCEYFIRFIANAAKNELAEREDVCMNWTY